MRVSPESTSLQAVDYMTLPLAKLNAHPNFSLPTFLRCAKVGSMEGYAIDEMVKFYEDYESLSWNDKETFRRTLRNMADAKYEV